MSRVKEWVRWMRVGPNRNIPWSIFHFPHWKCHRCDIWCDICDILWNLTITKKTFLNPSSCDNSGVVRKCPTWDIIPRSPFVSMKDISRFSWNLQNADLRAREEENGLRIMEYPRLGPTLSHIYEWVIFRMNESGQGMSHMNESCLPWTSHDSHEWVMFRMNESCFA